MLSTKENFNRNSSFFFLTFCVVAIVVLSVASLTSAFATTELGPTTTKALLAITSKNLSPQNNSSRSFYDYYQEAHWPRNLKTLNNYIQLKGGRSFKDSSELYVVSRSSNDTRTLFDKKSEVLNDNYIFLGDGIDYLGFIPGLRASLQVGRSFDLTDKINREGFDFRFGLQSYHKKNWSFYLESDLYSEILYTQRYKNINLLLKSSQFLSLFSSTIYSTNLKLGPLLVGSVSADTQKEDYNQFIEGQLGLRAWLGQGALSVTLSPAFVLGKKYLSGQTYHDFESLLVMGLRI